MVEEYFSLTLERMYTTTQQHVPDVNKLHNFSFVCVCLNNFNHSHNMVESLSRDIPFRIPFETEVFYCCFHSGPRGKNRIKFPISCSFRTQAETT